MEVGGKIEAVVFPARAGMIRGAIFARREVYGIPRESGDDPTYISHKPEVGPYSPRERG